VRKIVIAAAVLVCAGTAGAALWLGGIGPSRVVAAEAPAPPPVAPGVPVTVGKVVAADVPVLLNGIGTVQAFNMVTIKSRVDGQLMKVNFTEGQEVRAGDPLVEIDPRPYQAALEAAQAAKAKDEAQLISAQLDLARSAQLLKANFETRQLFDQQTATVAQLHAAIKGDQAQIDAVQLNLTYSDIRSPIDGRLGARLVDIGNIVHATDATGLVTITQLRPIFVSFTLPQDTLDRVHAEQAKGALVVQAYSGDNKVLLSEGTLSLIDNAIDQPTGTIHFKAKFANADERLWPGEFVNVRLILSTRHQVPTVPAQTVQVGPNGAYAYVIKADDTVERRDVQVTATQDGIAVISKGLEPGERVVVDGQYRLTVGARVKASAPAPGASG